MGGKDDCYILGSDDRVDRLIDLFQVFQLLSYVPVISGKSLLTAFSDVESRADVAEVSI